MGYNVPTVQDMVNTALKKSPAATPIKSTTKPATPTTYKSTIDQDEEQAMIDRMNAYANNHKNEPVGGGMWGPDAIRPSGYKNNAVTSSAPAIDYQAIYEAQLKAKAAALQKQRDSALSGLDTEQTKLANNMYGKRNQAAAQSDIGAMNFAQFMASRGVSGNAGAMPEIYRNAGLQSQIGALNQQEAAGNAQIQANRTNVNNAYQSDLMAAKNQMQADLLQATIDQQNVDRVAALEQQRYNATSKTAADVTAYNRLQDTKNEYANTIGQFSPDYQAEINKVKNDGDPSNDYQIAMLAAARQKKMSELEEIKTAEGKAAEAKQRETVNNAIQMFGQLGYLTPEMAEILQSYGLSTDIVSLNKYKAQNTSSNSNSNRSNGESWMYSD